MRVGLETAVAIVMTYAGITGADAFDTTAFTSNAVADIFQCTWKKNSSGSSCNSPLIGGSVRLGASDRGEGLAYFYLGDGLPTQKNGDEATAALLKHLFPQWPERESWLRGTLKDRSYGAETAISVDGVNITVSSGSNSDGVQSTRVDISTDALLAPRDRSLNYALGEHSGEDLKERIAALLRCQWADSQDFPTRCTGNDSFAELSRQGSYRLILRMFFENPDPDNKNDNRADHDRNDVINVTSLFSDKAPEVAAWMNAAMNASQRGTIRASSAKIHRGIYDESEDIWVHVCTNYINGKDAPEHGYTDIYFSATSDGCS